jgi:hypothetical protein
MQEKWPPETQKPSTLSDSLAGRREGLGHEEQLALYASAKQKQGQVSSWMVQHRPELVKQTEALRGCAQYLIFHDFYRINKVLLRGGITCKQHLLCAPCALRRSAAYAKAYYPVIQHVLQGNPGYAPVLITKTIRNSSDLKGLYSKFTKAHSVLLQQRRDAKKPFRSKNLTIYASLHGGVGSYEYKRGKNSGSWHPHSHEIALITLADWDIEPVEMLVWRKIDGKRQQVPVKVWKPLALESQLRQEWSVLTGGSWVCDVRMIGWDDAGQYDADQLFGAVAEVMGYCLKMQEISPKDQVQAYLALRRRRLTYTYGCLYNVEVPDEAYDTDERIAADEPWVERVYRWWRSREYQLFEVRQPEDALFSEPVTSGDARPKQRRGRKTVKATEDKVVAAAVVADWCKAMAGGAVPF